MDFYKMTDTERQTLINQYALLKKGEKNKEKIIELNKKIEYLEKGYIYLFKNLNSLDSIISEYESLELITILFLHEMINRNAKINNMNSEELAFDFNTDILYVRLAKDIIKSDEYPAFNTFEVKNSHGGKNIKDHRKQIKYWQNTLNKKVELNSYELKNLLNYQILP